ncbi:DUF3619 family protein [Methylotenera sp.]|uniref:DUF3619 family protein n=1 Tax=Methylotenera sp. TaxID=2051956 RepID=UPI0024889600|nr:DUF3619 family protein [Methylotenera sp.]MDI1297569.1 DUF3619 family protein [Methylotenera sp.]
MDTQKEMQNSKINNDLIGDEQVAKLAVNLLNDSAQHLNAVTLQRLSEARGFAVNKLEISQGVNQSGNVLQWVGHGFGSYFEQHRLMSAAIIVGAMLLTFFAAQKFNADNNLENSDAFLLASELPPEAFADKGFDTWLVSKRD